MPMYTSALASNVYVSYLFHGVMFSLKCIPEMSMFSQ